MRAALLVLGAALAGLAIMVEQPGAGPHSLPARVAVTVPATGELAVNPASPEAALRASLEPGEEATAYVRVVNQSPVPQRMRLVAAGGSRELDAELAVRLRAGTDPALHDGSLGALRSGSAPLLLLVGEKVRLELRASLPAAADSYEGRAATFDLVPADGE
jgi:hypothetical protein